MNLNSGLENLVRAQLMAVNFCGTGNVCYTFIYYKEKVRANMKNQIRDRRMKLGVS